jgi:hypothetical protein
VVERVATPPEIVPVPTGFVASKKVTLPVGLPPVTVAVRVTGCPNSGAAGETVSTVVLADRTTCDNADETLVPLPESPL